MNYRKLVPDNTFIAQYLDAMEDLESPQAYDFWTALWLIGTVCGREVYVDRPRIPVYLNWYVILVAESGITRKGNNISYANRLLADTDLLVLSGKTPSRTLEVLLHKQTETTNQAQAALCVPEMVTMFGRENGSITLPALLTDLYDCPAYRNTGGTVHHGQTELRNVFISLLTASTPSWLGTAINPSVIEGGFTSRCIFVCESVRKKLVPWPDARQLNPYEGLKSCLSNLRSEARQVQAIRVSDGGLRRFTNWYRKRTMHEDSFRSSFEAREDDHLLRLAGCLAINDGTYIIDAGHITKAIRVIDQHKQNAHTMFSPRSESIGVIGDGVNKIRDILVLADAPIAHSALYQKVRWKFSIDQFKTLMQIMHECDLVEVYQKREGAGKFYKAADKLTMPSSIDEAIRRVSRGQIF